MAESRFIDSTELAHLFIGILVLGFCFSFREWGTVAFNVSTGISNWIVACFLVAISFLVHELVHRWAAARYSAKVNFRLRWYAILTAIVLVFLTNGWFVFAAVGSVSLSYVLFRPGFKKPHLGPYESAKIAVSGPLANILFAVVALGLYHFWANPLLTKLMLINLWIGVINLFPFYRLPFHLLFRMVRGTSELGYKLAKAAEKPGASFFEGELVFFGSRPLWFFAFFFALSTAILLVTLKNPILAVTFAFLIGLAIYLIWHWFLVAWIKPGASKPTQAWWK